MKSITMVDSESTPSSATSTPPPRNLEHSSLQSNQLLGSIHEGSPLLPDAQTIRALPGMLVRAHRIDPQKRTIRLCPTKEALSQQQQRYYYWIDIDADTDRDRDELNEWFQSQLQVSSFLLARLAEPSETWASQVIALPSSVLAVIRILPEQCYYDNPEYDDMAFMAALSLPRLLLTFTSGPRAAVGALYGRALSYMQARSGYPPLSAANNSNNNTADALYSWLYFHVERTSRSIRNLRYQVLRMDEAMDREGVESVGIREIIDAKDHLLRLLGVAEEQHECLEALGATQSDVLSFPPGTLAIVTAIAAATERMALRLEKQIGDLRQRHEGFQQERMNRRLAVLTVLSAVFLPLTLITGTQHFSD